MNIDWSKAPEWVIAHALYAFGGEIREVWVGEEQYQRLDQSKPFPYGGGASSSFHNPRRYQFRYETLRPSPWTGEGLPPVGTVCEFAAYSVGGPHWKKCKVIAHDEGFAVINYHGSYSGYRAGDRLRPIRTPEEVAAEEREAAICAMMEVCSELPCRQSCADLYDAGYRKQVTP
ncbi:hypothetical protein EGM97_09345 [Pseudomonas sp. AF32]|uniref:hypothetical protein n=1 Tax=Pseudomonas sp. AF32 TaxID=554390 RepID=UPI001EEEF965|nr:hypothetical protein [Pseudomonas sp. AF32]MCG6574910.1 hypothetical protein [Pseudomonas sp. AF32]